jgi:hypothetical protein
MAKNFDKNVGPFLRKLGFKFINYHWALSEEKIVTVHGDGVSMHISLGNLYDYKHDYGFNTVSIEEGKNFLKENIKELKQLEKDSKNKRLGHKLEKILESLKTVDNESQVKSKSLKFKNMWLHYNFSMPKGATKGILYSTNVKENEALNKKVISLISPILKSQKFKNVQIGYNDGISYFEPLKKKESKKIPYVSRLIRGYDDTFGGIESAGIIVNSYKGKYKGVGKSASLYYFVLMIGGFTTDDTENPAVAVEVITPIDKGEDLFLNEVKKALTKLDIWKFNGKKIYVNKCSKAVTGSAESKVFAYKGQIITANSKQEAIQQIVAGKKFKPGNEVGVSIKILLDTTKKHKTDFGYNIDTSEKGYYDLKYKDGQVLCMDGEVCTIKSIDKDGNMTLINNNGVDETEFTLSKKEVDICVG